MYEMEVKERDLPAVVLNAAVSKYHNYKVEDAKKIVKGSKVLYKLEMENDRNKKDIKALFSHDGKLINERLD